MEAEEVYLSLNSSELFLKVRGHITAKYCRDLRRKIRTLWENSTGFNEITVDLSDCSYMDSTFLGLLVIFNRKYCLPGNTRISVLNPSETCCSLLRDTGLTDLVNLKEGPPAEALAQTRLACTDQVSLDLLLKTHEELISLSDENRSRFGNIRELLKNEALQTGRG